ncbi:MAG TPA: long-chain-fatty-acid--CoA ligase [Syntrophomonas sp.]|nr:long-chain-fatty-acid--CoA ligase [Syntrophomonas sp.]
MQENRQLSTISLNDLSFLKGRQLDFNSIAEMFVTRVKENPNATHTYFYDQIITYAQTNDRANQVANYLKEKGVKKGDVVSVMVLNSPEVYYTMFGTQKIGAISGAINYSLKGPEIAYVLDDSKPKVAFVGSEYMQDFAVGYALASHKPIIVEVKTEVAHDAKIAETTLADIMAKYPRDEALVAQNLDDPFLLLYSSGTTGNPKGILISNKAQFAVSKSFLSTGMFQENDVMMIIMPMFHTNPLCVWSYTLTYAGLTLCIRKSFSPADFWPAVLEYGVTLGMGVPAMYSYIFDSADPNTIDRSKLKLRYALCGAAPLPVELIKGFKEKFGVSILEGYGLTEVTGLSTINPPLGVKKAGSIGPAIPGQALEIMDDDNNIMPRGERGEICTYGDFNMIGYLNKPEATAETVKDGWLHTGDVGYMDEDGYVYIVDRKKDMINRGGENIYPREIEIVIEGNPKVAAVAVIGISDKHLGEKVKAFVVPKPGETLTEDEIKAFLKDKLAKYKQPEFVEVTDNIPRNATGKILKKELKQMEADKTRNA